jgi:hypothetical protein
MSFLNPYNFIPVNGNAVATKTFADLKADDNHVRHDYWLKDKYSGRFVCELECKTPTVVGSEQTQGTDDKAGIVEPYTIKINNKEEIALPANSLRGMISSIAESLSQSALRVLNDEVTYSIRDKNHKKIVKKLSVYEEFKRIDNNKNLLPLGKPHRDPIKEDTKLTPAELLFGFVSQENSEDKEKDKQAEPKSYNFASRLKFSDAFCLTTLKIEDLLGQQTLKILASPKPPSPAMYFKAANGNYIAKEKLNPAFHKPNGRKFYLHHPVAVNNIPKNQNWETKEKTDEDKNLKQKLSCTPIGTGTKFYFHIDFDNLDWDELSLLEKALNPDGSFVHRLGLGKPLGLGSVKLKICGLFFIDRVNRYRDLTSLRYSEVHGNYVDTWTEVNDLETLYPMENQAIYEADNNNNKFSNKFIDNDSLNVLKILGNPALLPAKTPVTYPYSTTEEPPQRPNGEQEGFKWFGNNHSQTLEPVVDSLPTLNPN